MSGDNHLNLLNEAYAMYALTNPLHGDCFPSVPRMEREVVQMTAALLGGGRPGVASVCGTMTSGGTESIMRCAPPPSLCWVSEYMKRTCSQAPFCLPLRVLAPSASGRRN